MWAIGKGVLWLLDGFFDIIDKIWRFEFFNNEYVNKIFSGAIIIACSWLMLKVIIELIMKYIVKNDGRDSPLSIYRGIVLAIVIMFLITPLFNFGHNISTALTEDIISVSGLDEGSGAESKISKAIVRAMVYENETKEEHIDEVVDNWKDIDINATEGGVAGFGDSYKYSLNFFMLIILGIVTIFLLFFVAIQMAKRVMELALFKIIGPFCCTSLTNNGRAFETWTKSSMGLFLVTAVQFVSIGLMLAMFGSAFKGNGNMTGVFLVIGALLFIIGTPTIINSLLGQQTGMMSAFGDMQSLMALGHASAQGLGIAKAGVSGALSIGTQVGGSGKNIVQGGMNKISSALERGSSLTSTQKGFVQESFNNNNPFRARQQINQFLDSNTNGQFSRVLNRTPDNMFNPIKNHYFNQSSMNHHNNDIGGKM